MSIKLPEGMTNEMCQYLEDLRVSGETNMFGARPYLQDEYELGSKDAGAYLSFWMQNYEKLREADIIVRGG